MEGKLKNPILFLYLLSILFPLNVFSQKYQFRNYGIEQGICHNIIYAINQDKNGFIWIGTGEGICRYNGFTFDKAGTDTLATSVANNIFRDHKQNLWFGFDNGKVIRYDGRKFQDLQIETNSKIVGFVQLKNQKEYVIAATQNDGFFLINEDNSVARIKEGLEGYFLTTIDLTDNNELLVGTFTGLYLFKFDIEALKAELVHTFTEVEFVKIESVFKSRDDDFFIGTDGEGFYNLNLTESKDPSFMNLGEQYELGDITVQSIFEDRDRSLWICTFDEGIYRLLYDSISDSYADMLNYSERNGLISNDIKIVFEDREGIFWIGTFGDGLVSLPTEAFVAYGFTDHPVGKDITAVFSKDKSTWLGSSDGLVLYPDGLHNEYRFFNAMNGLPRDEITSLYEESGKLWIGTDKSGLYVLNTSNYGIKSYRIADYSLGNSINHITGRNDTIWVSTKNGVYVFCEGSGLNRHFSTNDGLPHNNINEVYLDRENRAWVMTKSNGLCYIQNCTDILFEFSEGMQEIEFVSLTEDGDGNLWAATADFGVIKFSEDTLISISPREGLKSSYCYSIANDRDQFIWVGHRLGLSRINIQNQSVNQYGPEYGITGDNNLNAVSLKSGNELLFGTTEGLVVYNPEKDKKNLLPPFVNITALYISDIPYDFSKDIVLPYNIYKLRLEYIGLDYTAPHEVTYQYKLDGFDLEWGDMTDARFALYSRLADGKYRFLLKACNNESICNETPIAINITVKLPFWKTWWFISLAAVVLILTVIIIIKIRERKQKELQEFLQRSLDERTREVVKQKEEIEIKNKDITDSINYAYRIQASILPPIKRLQNHFSGSFVFYQPRDIVSGDFYWFDLVKNNKFVIVCADSTGHGVPGAFMSMIGTTLIKDVVAKKDVQTPSDILVRLDYELTNTLNQNIEAERSNDGMDIIVCEIDIKTLYMRMASAMRPVIIYQNGQQVYVKGSRSSIGGHLNKEAKTFKNEGFQLSKGDLVYMFSDGYPDQFGGPMEKKFKMVRLKNLLKDIYKKPMEEQYQYVKSTFNLWKEDLEQVDDVLFMGIRI